MTGWNTFWKSFCVVLLLGQLRKSDKDKDRQASRKCVSLDQSYFKVSICSTNNPQPCLDPPNQNDTMAKDR